MEPNPVWDDESYAPVVETFAALGERLTVRVWGADWCGDCRSTLPDFAAAMDAAGIEGDRLHVYPVDRGKDGELTDEYGVEFIPTIVVEVDGEEAARFVESEPVSPAQYLADELADVGATA